MTTFTITSATTTDVVSLGDMRDRVRKVLGEYRTFSRTPTSEEADQFVGSGAMATYSAEGDLVMLELVEPALAVLDGVQLVGERLDDVVEALGAMEVEVVLDDIGASVPSVSVGLYAPDGTVEGVQLGSD